MDDLRDPRLPAGEPYPARLDDIVLVSVLADDGKRELRECLWEDVEHYFSRHRSSRSASRAMPE